MRRHTRLAVLLCLLSCRPVLADPAALRAADLTGHWISTETLDDERRADTRMEVRGDGSFSGSLQINDQTVWRFGGRWQLHGSSIHWEYTESSLVLLVEDESEVDRVLTHEPDRLQLRSDRRDTVRTLQRVK